MPIRLSLHLLAEAFDRFLGEDFPGADDPPYQPIITTDLAPSSVASAIDTRSALSLEEIDEFDDEFPLEATLPPHLGYAMMASPFHIVGSTELQVAQLEKDTINGVRMLGQFSHSTHQPLRALSFDALAQVYQNIAPNLEPFVVQGPIFASGRRLDDWLGRAKEGIGTTLGRKDQSHVKARARFNWTATGVALSALAAALILVPEAWIAVPILIALRQLLSILFGSPGTLPLENIGGHVTKESVYRCWAAHISDAIVLLGFLAFGVLHSSLIALTAAVALAATLLGVILRLSAWQLAIEITRLHLERLIRVWPPLLGLIVGTLVANQSTIAICAGLVLGPILYGVGEQVRAFIRIHRELRDKEERSVTIIAEDHSVDGTRPTFKVYAPSSRPMTPTPCHSAS